MILYDHQLKDYDFNIEYNKGRNKKKDGTYTIKKRSHNILTFDIETTSAWLKDGQVIPYQKGFHSDYWNELEHLALPYIWQFSIDGIVYYGREFNTFLNVLDDLPADTEFIIWVHNLSYEFQFLTNILNWSKVFARSPRKPIKAVSKEYPKITFRCSYVLTGLSLASWGKQLGTEKAIGLLDYEKIRTPLTELTQDEMYYCKQDCIVVETGIKEYIKRYGNQYNIPMTQTGTVRRVVKDKLTSDELYVHDIKSLVPRSAAEYRRLQDVFAGGYTHANRMYSGFLVEGTIEHYDFASSYPTVMIAEKYPMTRWILLDRTLPDISTFDNYAYILRLEFTNIRSISMNTYIQASKCEARKIVYDNGRIISADILIMTMTEQDFITIKNNYIWDDLKVLYVYRSRKEYLPKAFTEYILELYANKTELKDVEGMEDLYMQSKQYINSLFGMCVTAIIQADVVLNENNEWSISDLTTDMVNERLFKLRSKNPREKRYFLSYAWGCWVTAYARRNLWKCIESCDTDVIYCDTDSIFVRGQHNFEWYNNDITEKIKTACDIMELDFNKTRPLTPKGKPKPLGIFDKEDNCEEFLTLGAKRYVERRTSDHKLHLTVSGINKDAVELLQDDIENFEDGFDFDKDADCVHKQLSTYLSDMPTVTYPDGYVSNYRYGINLRRTGYKLTISDDYAKLLKLCHFNTSEISERGINILRSRF